MSVIRNGFVGVALSAMLSEKMPDVRATATGSPGSAIEVFPPLQRAERAGGMHVSYDLVFSLRNT